MYGVCKTCGHLKNDHPHECPDDEYIKARDRLIEAAAELTEQMTEAELAELEREIFCL